MNKVILRLNGGLGNQMFQYAFGRAIAEHHGAEIEIDRSLYDLPYVPERYRLDEFSLNPKFTPGWRSQVHRVLLSAKLPAAMRAFLCWVTRTEIVLDKPVVSAERGRALLVGYFQFPKAFQDNLDILRQELTFPIKGAYPTALLARIKAGPSVAVHIRRGDYVSVSAFSNTLGVLSADYYHQAMDVLRARLGPVRFFVFSNDPAWVRDHILPQALDAEQVDLGKDGRDITEMGLMTACDHFVVANSTFSWWPAMLAPGKDKVVIAPDPWFRNASGAGADLLLPKWVRQKALWDSPESGYT